MRKTAAKKRQRYSNDAIQECLRVMESATGEDLFEILPKVGVIRDARFREPLLSLLSHRDPKHREFAAYAMGAMADREFLDPLKQAFHEAHEARGSRAEGLQTAIVEAIGAIGDDAAVEFFLPFLRRPPTGKQAAQLRRQVVESMGNIAQQGGKACVSALMELTAHEDPEMRAQAVSELSIAFWHRPNDVTDDILHRICDMTRDPSRAVAESALAALQSLADVGCSRAERLFCKD